MNQITKYIMCNDFHADKRYITIIKSIEDTVCL
jgi:hypothetical protein